MSEIIFEEICGFLQKCFNETDTVSALQAFQGSILAYAATMSAVYIAVLLYSRNMYTLAQMESIRQGIGESNLLDMLRRSETDLFNEYKETFGYSIPHINTISMLSNENIVDEIMYYLRYNKQIYDHYKRIRGLAVYLAEGYHVTFTEKWFSKIIYLLAASFMSIASFFFPYNLVDCKIYAVLVFGLLSTILVTISTSLIFVHMYRLLKKF